MTHRPFATSNVKMIGVASAAVVMAGATLAYANAARADTSLEVGSSTATLAQSGHISTFKLTNVNRSAVLSSSEPRELQICNQTGKASPLDEASAAPPFMPSGAATLQVSYKGRTEQITPGECYRVHSSQVRIEAESSIDPGSSLQGTVAWVVPGSAGMIKAPRAAADNTYGASGEINQIRHELKQIDRTAQQSTAEFNKASRELDLAAQELR